MSGEEQAQDLAQNFYEVERDEQRRLMETMQKHASESGADPRSKKLDVRMTGDEKENEPVDDFLLVSVQPWKEVLKTDTTTFGLMSILESNFQNLKFLQTKDQIT